MVKGTEHKILEVFFEKHLAEKRERVFTSIPYFGNGSCRGLVYYLCFAFYC